jgi:hypothetical protein
VAAGAGAAAVQVGLDVGLGQASPGGQPSITQPMAGPWLSPKLVTRKSAEGAAGHDIREKPF